MLSWQTAVAILTVGGVNYTSYLAKGWRQEANAQQPVGSCPCDNYFSFSTRLSYPSLFQLYGLYEAKVMNS